MGTPAEDPSPQPDLNDPKSLLKAGLVSDLGTRLAVPFRQRCSPSVEGDGVPGISYRTKWRKALSVGREAGNRAKGDSWGNLGKN